MFSSHLDLEMRTCEIKIKQHQTKCINPLLPFSYKHFTVYHFRVKFTIQNKKKTHTFKVQVCFMKRIKRKQTIHNAIQCNFLLFSLKKNLLWYKFFSIISCLIRYCTTEIPYCYKVCISFFIAVTR